MPVTYETVNPTPIANAVVEKGYLNGVHKIYRIQAADGYVLHDNRYDEQIVDPDTLEPTGEIVYRYAIGSTTVAANYDFTVIVPGAITDINGNVITVNKVGMCEFFAVPISAVPENNTYGVIDNEQEVM